MKKWKKRGRSKVKMGPFHRDRASPCQWRWRNHWTLPWPRLKLRGSSVSRSLQFQLRTFLVQHHPSSSMQCNGASLFFVLFRGAYNASFSLPLGKKKTEETTDRAAFYPTNRDGWIERNPSTDVLKKNGKDIVI